MAVVIEYRRQSSDGKALLIRRRPDAERARLIRLAHAARL
jgi:hypothetical protein